MVEFKPGLSSSPPSFSVWWAFFTQFTSTRYISRALHTMPYNWWSALLLPYYKQNTSWLRVRMADGSGGALALERETKLFFLWVSARVKERSQMTFEKRIVTVCDISVLMTPELSWRILWNLTDKLLIFQLALHLLILKWHKLRIMNKFTNAMWKSFL